jgi:hypothetical protein
VHTVSEAEAIELLSRPLMCRDESIWNPLREQPNVHLVECGLLDELGLPSGLYAVLQYHRSPDTRLVRHLFTVFKLHHGGPQRVYQLDVRNHAKTIKNLHDLAHEHMGMRRINGEATWQQWTFEEVLQHFCQQTKISFDPPLDHPEDFKLRP